jgi:hypothetical protein
MGIIRDMQRVHATQTADNNRASSAAAQQRDLIRRNADLAVAAAQQAANDAERQREHRRLYVDARNADAGTSSALGEAGPVAVRPATTASSSPGGILQAHPPPCAYWVSRIFVGAMVTGPP